MGSRRNHRGKRTGADRSGGALVFPVVLAGRRRRPLGVVVVGHGRVDKGYMTRRDETRRTTSWARDSTNGQWSEGRVESSERDRRARRGGEAARKRFEHGISKSTGGRRSEAHSKIRVDERSQGSSINASREKVKGARRRRRVTLGEIRRCGCVGERKVGRR
jgi:hypothetical protein